MFQRKEKWGLKGGDDVGVDDEGGDDDEGEDEGGDDERDLRLILFARLSLWNWRQVHLHWLQVFQLRLFRLSQQEMIEARLRERSDASAFKLKCIETKSFEL